MFKKIIIFILLFQFHFIYANEVDKEIIDPPGNAALNIIMSSLSSLKELKTKKEDTLDNINELINLQILPNLNILYATQVAIKTHWSQLNDVQKNTFEGYIIQSLIKDYSVFLTNTASLDEISIDLLPNTKRKENRAMVDINIKLNKKSQPIKVSLKMICNKKWQIYDLVFSGVSLLKNYQAQFNSHIRRKGLDSLIAKISVNK